MIETNNNETTTILKRTHKKPYKVGKLFFGRSSNERGANWVVSSNPDLSGPQATFDIGKLARAYCEEQRDMGKTSAPEGIEISNDMDTYSDVPAEVGILTGEEPFEVLEDLTDEDEMGTVEI
jgi:hypothetical protein